MERSWVSSPAYEVAIRFLAEKRKGAQLTQRELAARLGKHRSFIAKIEIRERRLDIVEFIAIARALGVEPGTLVEEMNLRLPTDLSI